MRTFCCCLPVRLGVFVLSIVMAAFCGFIGFVSFLQVHSETGSEKISMICTGVTEMIVALAAITGFIGSIMASRGAVSFYQRILIVHFIIDLALGIWMLISIFDTTKTQDRCVASLNGNPNDASWSNDDKNEACSDFIKVGKWIYLAVWIVVKLVEIYLIHIVTQYKAQLQEEQGFAAIKRLESEYHRDKQERMRDLEGGRVYPSMHDKYSV